MKHIWGKFLRFTTVALLAAGPAFAADAPLAPFNLKAQYGFYWNGLPFGEMEFSSEQNAHGYKMTAVIRSTGLAALFAPHESRTTVEATGTVPETAKRIYETNYKTRDEPRRVKLTYASGGAATEVIVEPPEDPKYRPPPTHAQLAGTLDPLSFVLAVRRHVHDAQAKDETHFTLRLFEGRRLMETPFEVQGGQWLRLHGEKTWVIHCVTRRVPVAGYTAKELKSLAAGDPSLHILFSADDQLVPVKLYVDTSYGRIYAVREMAY